MGYSNCLRQAARTELAGIRLPHFDDRRGRANEMGHATCAIAKRPSVIQAALPSATAIQSPNYHANFLSFFAKISLGPHAA